jgi:hypothetical protein
VGGNRRRAAVAAMSSLERPTVATATVKNKTGGVMTCQRFMLEGRHLEGPLGDRHLLADLPPAPGRYR